MSSDTSGNRVVTPSWALARCLHSRGHGAPTAAGEPGLCLLALVVEAEGTVQAASGLAPSPHCQACWGRLRHAARARGPGGRHLASAASPGPADRLSPRLPRPVLWRPLLMTAASRSIYSGFKPSKDLGQTPLAARLVISPHVVLQKPHPAEDLWEPAPLPSLQAGKGPSLPCRSRF